jgi:hypothetical protein
MSQTVLYGKDEAITLRKLVFELSWPVLNILGGRSMFMCARDGVYIQRQ